MAWNIYDTFRKQRLDPVNSAISGTLKCGIVASGYSVNQNTHDFWNDITNEVTGTGYTAKGNALASPTLTMDGSGNITYDAGDPAAWTENASGFSTGRRAILHFDTGTSSTSTLMCYSDDFGADKGNTTGDFSIVLDAAGIWTNAR